QRLLDGPRHGAAGQPAPPPCHCLLARIALVLDADPLAVQDEAAAIVDSQTWLTLGLGVAGVRDAGHLKPRSLELVGEDRRGAGGRGELWTGGNVQLMTAVRADALCQGNARFARRAAAHRRLGTSLAASTWAQRHDPVDRPVPLDIAGEV